MVKAYDNNKIKAVKELNHELADSDRELLNQLSKDEHEAMQQLERMLNLNKDLTKLPV
jgi:hypothetical protein